MSIELATKLVYGAAARFREAEAACYGRHVSRAARQEYRRACRDLDRAVSEYIQLRYGH